MSEPIELEQAVPPEALVVRKEAMALLAQRTGGILIKSRDEREVIAQEMVQIQSNRKKWSSLMRPVVDKAHATWKSALGALNFVDKPMELGYESRRTAIAAWDDKVEREQKAEAMRRQREAEEAAARERIEREAELERQMNAQREAAEEAARKAALLEEQGRTDEAQALMEKASALEDEARSTEAAISESEAESVAPIILPPVEVEKSEHTSSRKDWDFQIVDKTKLKNEFLVPDEVAIRRVVKAMGENAVTVIGAGSINVFQKRIVMSKAAR